MRPGLLVLVVVGALAGLAGCDGDDAGDATEFCEDVADNVEELRADPATDDDVEDLIELWRSLGDEAPLAIEQEWEAHADNLETAWTSDDRQAVMESAFATERSAVAIATWLSDNCGIDFGPVTTIVPGTVAVASLPSSTTTTTSTTPG